MFEKLAKIAKEKYGVNITRKKSNADSTFEALFGISVDDIPESELPYEIPDAPPVRIDKASKRGENAPYA